MATILPFKSRGILPLLREARDRQALVRLWREELELGSYCGFVGDIGREFFTMWVLGDNLAFDGIHLLRQRDVSDIEVPDKHHEFLQKAMAINGLELQLPEALQLDDVRAMIQSVTARADVISVRVDNGNPEEIDVCYVGRLVGCEDDGFSLQEITPEAQWLHEPSFFAWEEISTVCYADPYATVLAKVAGKPPKLGSQGAGLGKRH